MPGHCPEASACREPVDMTEEIPRSLPAIISYEWFSSRWSFIDFIDTKKKKSFKNAIFYFLSWGLEGEVFITFFSSQPPELFIFYSGVSWPREYSVCGKLWYGFLPAPLFANLPIKPEVWGQEDGEVSEEFAAFETPAVDPPAAEQELGSLM